MDSRDPVLDRLAATERARRSLVERGFARQASSSVSDAAYFLAAEVASVLEHRRGVVLDPRTMSALQLAEWHAREPLALANLEPEPRVGALVLIAHGAPIGTICFDDFEGLSPFAHISSLYVAPAERRRGAASQLLDVLQTMLSPPYIGLSLTTYWTWPRAVRFYLRHGGRVRQWKHALVFLWRTPALRWELSFAGDVATFVWLRDGSAPQTWTARRGAEWLEWHEPSERTRDWSDATMTFAVALASRGWPIARSAEALEDGWRWSDVGYPEGLAVKLEHWEAFDRDRGFLVETPRIPSLPYRSWAELNGDSTG